MITDAIILAGGFGTRLHPLTLERPKALLPIDNRPFLETQFKRLRACGIRRVHLSVGHQADKIARAVPALKTFGLKVRLRREKEPLGTGGAIRFAWPDRKKACLVLNGDVLSDADIKELLKTHELGQGLATLWLVKKADTSAYGVIELDDMGRILRFVEKPRPGQSRSHLINAGLYALGPGVLSAIPSGRAVSVEREVFPSLLGSGSRMLGHIDAKKPYWNDIGTPQAYLQANLDWSGRLNVKGKGCQVGAGATLRGCLLMDGATVGPGAVLKSVILGPGAFVAAGTRVPAGSVIV